MKNEIDLKVVMENYNGWGNLSKDQLKRIKLIINEAKNEKK